MSNFGLLWRLIFFGIGCTLQAETSVSNYSDEGGGSCEACANLYNCMTIKAITNHILQNSHFSVLIHVISMVYCAICIFSLRLGTIYQVRYNLAYIILISINYLL